MAKEEALVYLEHVRGVLEEALKDLARDRPAEPLLFLSKFFADKHVAQIAQAAPVDFFSVRAEIDAIVKEKGCGPILVRLSWHDAGTYCLSTKTGGPRGCLRFVGGGEAAHAANAGLTIAVELLAPIKAKFHNIGFADLWSLAAVQAIETMGGPKVPWRPGRKDALVIEDAAPDGRLPDAAQGAKHLRDVFGHMRMGFSDQEIVALCGAHTVGACHPDRSGFEGPWTANEKVFDNSYFVDLLNKKWEEEKVESTGNLQFGNHDGGVATMMLPADMSLLSDEGFRPWVEKYAADQALFFDDFAKAFAKLQELGVAFV